MGLFSDMFYPKPKKQIKKTIKKNPSQSEMSAIESKIFEVQMNYKFMQDGCGVELFVGNKKKVLKLIDELVDYEKEYPDYFKYPKPSDNKKIIMNNLSETERYYVDYFLDKLEKKLLNYSTMRGKQNNFNKETNIFMYYASEFLPQTVKYFEEQIQEKFSEYIQ